MSAGARLAIVLAVAVLGGCALDRADERRLPGAEAVSLRGQSLFTPPIAEADRIAHTRRLLELRPKVEADPQDLDSLILYGRTLGALGHFRDALAAFRLACERHSDDPRPWRYRGHRWITVRRFDRAVADLERAAELIEGRADEVEPTLSPNVRGIDLDTLHENVWYHLGLAHYLRGDFEKALAAFRRCRGTVRNDDGRAMVAYWLAMTAERLGRPEDAREALGFVHPGMDIVEYHAYYKLALLWKGSRDADSLLGEARAAGQLSVDFATIGYGVANWLYCQGQVRRARELLEEVARTPMWHAFGSIAAEADLVRMAGAAGG